MKNKKCKFFLMLFVILIMSMSLFPVMAIESNNEITTEIPIVYFNSYEEYEAYWNNQNTPYMERYSSNPTVITASVIRNGILNDCELHLNWKGTDMYQGWRFKEIKVKETSILFPETYETFGDGVNYTTKNVISSSTGSVEIGDLIIPRDVEKVKVTSSGLQGYNKNSEAWLSATEWAGTVTIN